MPAVSWEQVSKRFGPVCALSAASADAAAAQCTVLLGPVGAGKTTLIRIALGLEAPDDGRAFLEDRPVDQLSVIEKNALLVAGPEAILPRTRVGRYIATALQPQGIPRKQRELRVEKTAKLVGLTAKLDRPMRALSGPEQCRANLARALARQVGTLFLDDPLKHLPPNQQETEALRLARLARQASLTLVYATRDEVQARILAQRIVLMDAGKVLQQSSPRELYDQPENLSVAAALGSDCWNLLPGHIEPISSGRRQLVLSKKIALLPAPPTLKKEAESVVLGVRPRAVSIGMEVGQLPSQSPAWTATVALVQREGADRLLALKTEDLLVRARGAAEAFPPEALETGAKVFFCFRPGSLRLFDADTGEDLLQS